MDELKDSLFKVENIKFIGLSFNNTISEELIQDEPYYIIGNDYENKIGVNKHSLKIYSIYSNGKTFINSSLKQLVQCIFCFTNIIDFDAPFDEDKRYEDIKKIKMEFIIIDKDALKQDSWWDVVLEESENGLL